MRPEKLPTKLPMCPLQAQIQKTTQLINDGEARFSIFPNPSSTFIHLQLPSTPTTITLINLLGEKVKEENVTGKEVTMDVSSLPDGLYLVRTENKVVGKFVKE